MSKNVSLVGMELADLREFLGPEQPRYRAQQLFDALYKKHVANFSEITNLPQPLLNQLVTISTLGGPNSEKQFESSDGTKRYLLKLEDNRTVETVLMPEDNRDTICISSQIGCPVDCKFCLTALMGLERNLTAGEIVGQVLFVARENGIVAGGSRMNVVMMGMG